MIKSESKKHQNQSQQHQHLIEQILNQTSNHQNTNNTQINRQASLNQNTVAPRKSKSLRKQIGNLMPIRVIQTSQGQYQNNLNSGNKSIGNGGYQQRLNNSSQNDIVNIKIHQREQQVASDANQVNPKTLRNSQQNIYKNSRNAQNPAIIEIQQLFQDVIVDAHKQDSKMFIRARKNQISQQMNQTMNNFTNQSIFQGRMQSPVKYSQDRSKSHLRRNIKRNLNTAQGNASVESNESSPNRELQIQKIKKKSRDINKTMLIQDVDQITGGEQNLNEQSAPNIGSRTRNFISGQRDLAIKSNLSQYGNLFTRNQSLPRNGYRGKTNNILRPQTQIGVHNYQSTEISQMSKTTIFKSNKKRENKQKNQVQNQEIVNISLERKQNLNLTTQYYSNGAYQKVGFNSKMSQNNDTNSNDFNTSQMSYFEQYAKRERNSLSPFTKLTNTQLKEQLGRLNELEHQKIACDQKTLTMDASELLHKTNREIKSLNYKLMRVITSDDHYHTILNPYRNNEIEVIEQTYILCKVNVKGQMTPARFNVQFKHEMNSGIGASNQLSLNKRLQKQPDLKVFVSTHCKEPNEQNNDKAFINQRKFVFSSPQDKHGKFTSTDYLYLSFLSLAGCSIVVRITFPQEGNDPGYKILQQQKQIQTQQTVIEGEDPQLQTQKTINQTEYKKDIKEIEESLMETLKKYTSQKYGYDFYDSPSIDFINKNKSIIPHWSYFQGVRRSQFHGDVQQKLILAQQKKEDLQNEKRKKNVFGLVKWDFIRQKKFIKQKAQEEYSKKQFQKMQWVLNSKNHLIMKAIYDKFDALRQRIKREKQMKNAVIFLMRISRRYFKKKGVEFKNRTLKAVQQSLSFAFVKTHDIVENRAAKSLQLFLHDTSQIYDLKQKFITFHLRIQHIQNSYRNRCQCLLNRKLFLINYFDKEKAFLVKFYLQKKSQKKPKSLVKRLNLLDNDVRDHIIKIYFEKCTFDYSVKFNHWRIKMHGENSGVDIETMTMRNELLLKKEQLLFQGTEIVDEDQTAVASRLAQRGSDSANVSPVRRNRGGTFKFKRGGLHQDKESRKISEMPPMFLSMPSREVLHKLIIKASQFKNIEDLRKEL
eukprot:403353959